MGDKEIMNSNIVEGGNKVKEIMVLDPKRRRVETKPSNLNDGPVNMQTDGQEEIRTHGEKDSKNGQLAGSVKQTRLVL